MGKKAFSLAETLITLTIIGVIAVLTVPNLIKKYEDQQTITGVKTAYSLLDNALKLMYQEEGNPQDWAWPATTAEKGDFFMKKLSNYLKVEKYCGNADGCFKYGYFTNWTYFYISFDGRKGANYHWTERNRYGKTILKNNMHICLHNINIDDKRGIGTIRVDINGQKQPNRIGYDTFFFHINNKGLNLNVPDATSASNAHGLVFSPEHCYTQNTSHNSGHSCSTWIIKHGNIDYKYRDVRGEW